jgi:hypothetical protein
MTTANNPAPYPTSAADVTAEGLARHLAVQAQRTNAQIMTASGLNRDAMARFVYEWGVTFLLREALAHLGPVAADDIARDLWEAWQDGGSPGEFLWEWLTEYGIDPEQVSA